MCHTEQILFFVSFSFQLFSFPLICSYDSLEEENVFYFGSCIRFFNSQIFSVTQFIHLSSAAYTSLLNVFYGKLLQITELKGRKRELCTLQAFFMAPFSFWLCLLQICCFMCVYVCVFPCLTQLGTDIILYEQWLPKGLGVTICGREPTGLH